MFAIPQQSLAIRGRLNDEGFELLRISGAGRKSNDLDQVKSIATSKGADWILLDGYQFDYGYQFELKGAGRRILLIDDWGSVKRYCVDIVLDQNNNANEAFYKQRLSSTRLLLGLKYALLRSEFLRFKGFVRKTTSPAKRVLVTLGGADPYNVTLGVARMLDSPRFRDLEVTLVSGMSNPGAEKLAREVAKSSIPMRLVKNAPDMASLMAWADVAITAPGITCWEMMFMGLPFIAVPVVESQRKFARLEGLNCFGGSDFNELAKVFSRLIVDVKSLKAMNERGQEAVDGEGVTRVLTEMTRALG